MKRTYLAVWISGFFSLSCFAMENVNEKRPPEHFCPITLDVMKDPVVASDGHSYEKIAILQYLDSTYQPKSPITGLPLLSKNLIENQTLKTMIMDWKPGARVEPFVLETRSAHKMAEQVRKEFEKNAQLLNAAKDRDIVAFLGNTGAGKSTLVNLLAGKGIRVSDENEDYVLVDPKDPAAMVIGLHGSSETLYPKFIDVGDLRFFDLPGFNDTDGSERNLVNAAFIRRILLDARSVRLVFVAGMDQFTSDRSSSVRQMFNSLKQLFVLDENINLVDNAVFIATKVACNTQADITEVLLRKTDSKDKADLHEQLQSWSQSGRMGRMYHPLRDEYNKGIKEQILDLIHNAKSSKIRGINVSALYPPDTKGPLERMFLKVLEDALDRMLTKQIITLSEYKAAIDYYSSDDFWKRFEEDVSEKDDALSLLKQFCNIPYTKSMQTLEKEHEKKRKDHIVKLKEKQAERIEDIQDRTSIRTNEVITHIVPPNPDGYYVTFDFAYHREFHDQVCGGETMGKLAIDPMEQEVVRSHFAHLISLHSHKQMESWFKKFAGTYVEGTKKSEK